MYKLFTDLSTVLPLYNNILQVKWNLLFRGSCCREVIYIGIWLFVTPLGVFAVERNVVGREHCTHICYFYILEINRYIWKSIHMQVIRHFASWRHIYTFSIYLIFLVRNINNILIYLNRVKQIFAGHSMRRHFYRSH